MTETSSRDPLLQTLPEALPEGPPWLFGLRRDAADKLRTEGFPTKKHEAWRFTSVKPITSVGFRPAEKGDASAQAFVDAHLGEDGTCRVVIDNGRPLIDAVLTGAPEGVTVMSLSRLLAESPGTLEKVFGKLASKEPFSALNAALFEDGLVVNVSAGALVDKPIHLVFVGSPSAGPTAAYPRALVLAGKGSQVRLVETHLVRPGEKHLTNAVTEVYLGANANVDHVRISEGAENGYQVAELVVHQDRDSVYTSHVVTLGGALFRLDLRAVLDGEGAECTLNGLFHAKGEEHVDHHTLVEHAKPRATSRERYRGVLDERGRGVFDGIVKVHVNAVQTVAHQENRNLLLSNDAGVHTKPHLEIENDDVKCSHGATIGSLDEKQLFYLRARGIDKDQARAILTFAFVRELLDKIPEEAIRERLCTLVLARMPQGDGVGEIA